jgi:uncharacterized membrane protein
MTSYGWLTSLHVVGAVLLLGNSIVTAYWKVLADRTRLPAVVAFAQRGANLADFVFLVPGIALLAVTGYVNALVNDIEATRPGLLVGQILFYVAGAGWLLVLVPTQRRQGRLARDFATGEAVPEEYWALNRRWMGVGAVVTVALLAAIFAMFWK